MKVRNFVITNAGMHSIPVILAAECSDLAVESHDVFGIKNTEYLKKLVHIQRQKFEDKDASVKYVVYSVGMKHTDDIMRTIENLYKHGITVKVFHNMDMYMNINRAQIDKRFEPYVGAGVSIFKTSHTNITMCDVFIANTTGLSIPQIEALKAIDSALLGIRAGSVELADIIRNMCIMLSKIGTLVVLKNIILSLKDVPYPVNMVDKLSDKDIKMPMNVAMKAISKIKTKQFTLVDKLTNNVDVGELKAFMDILKDILHNDVFMKCVRGTDTTGMKTTSMVPRMDLESIYTTYLVQDVDGYVDYITRGNSIESEKIACVLSVMLDDEFISIQLRCLDNRASAIGGLIKLADVLRGTDSTNHIYNMGGTSKSAGGLLTYESYDRLLDKLLE